MTEAKMGASSPGIDEAVALAAAVGAQLRAADLICATAESCTGGLIGHLLTENAGSSDYFAGGAIVYSYAAKETVLGVKRTTLAAVGAVSADVAQQMAQGARRLYLADVAVSVTGIAGPGGGLPGKAVGTVFIHLSAADGFEASRRCAWTANRSDNKLLSARAALQMMVDYLEQRA